jgi:hypothetical protein
MNLLASRDAAAEIVNACLAPGEQLLWVGRPKLGFAIRAFDLVFIPFTSLWLMGAIGSLIVLLRQEGVISLRFTIPFVLFGVAFLVERYWFDAKLRGRTFYGVTNRRAIILTYWLRQEIQSVYYKDLLELRPTLRRDNTGTLEFLIDLGRFNLSQRGVFGYNRSDLWFAGARHLRFPIPPAFEMIARPLEVERLILAARDAARASAMV